MHVTLSPEARKAKRDTEAKASFATFMERSETKLLLSMVPAADQPELIQTLMRSAFDAGHGHGEASIAVEMVGAMLDGMDKNRERGDR